MAALTKHSKHSRKTITTRGLVRIGGLALLIAICLWVGQIDRVARAVAIAPELSAGVSSLDYAQGQAGFADVAGAYPLTVSISLDGKPLDVFWGGEDYWALFAFSLDTPPGEHTLLIEAVNPVDGTSLRQTYPLKVHATSFPTDDVDVSPILVPLLDPKLNQQETDELAAIYSVTTHPTTFPWPFAMPVEDATIVSSFGDYRIYNGGMLTSRHTGVDLRRRLGDPVLATAAGRVAAAQPFKIHGNAIVIDHGYGVYSLYAHLAGFLVKPGEWVQQGQEIGLAGFTGRATGPHLHFEIIINGMSVDPIRWLALSPYFVPPKIDSSALAPGM